MRGKIRKLNNPLLSIETLESGHKVIWCDHTINNLIQRCNNV